ncbi:MAG: hypothetical protein HC830_15220 [Bacteroidetes bacterium]|nr:hypothetical protein [Bacteroidota bacterium]
MIRSVSKYQAMGNLYADISFLKYFTYHVNYGGTVTDGKYSAFQTNAYYGSKQVRAATKLNAGRTSGYIQEFAHYLTFNFNSSAHNFNVVAGHNTNQNYDEVIEGERTDLPLLLPYLIREWLQPVEYNRLIMAINLNLSLVV